MLTSCNNNLEKYELYDIEVQGVTKWFNDYKSAYSVTYDTGRPDLHETENNWLLDHELFLDYEIVSSSYDQYPSAVTYLREELIDKGFGYFGHGHTHISHDAIDYEEAKSSFTQNYESMVSYGLHPVSYAYPNGAGRLPETRQALEESGFLSGRLFQPVFEEYGPYIMPNGENEPPDWFALPSLRMEDIDFQGRSRDVNNPKEFIEYLNKSIELGSWIISTYHGIGWDGETDGRPRDWGFYRRINFYVEMIYAKAKSEQGDVWLASMNDVTLYARQRVNTVYLLDRIGRREFRLFFGDGYENDLYRMPLTLKLGIDNGFVGQILTVRSPDNEILIREEITSGQMLINLHPSEINYYISIDEIDDQDV